MRIISKWHDYYDGVMKTGMDREVVYVRDTVEHKIKPIVELGHSSRSHKDLKADLYILGFCSQIYKIAIISDMYGPNKFIFYDFEEFKKAALLANLASSWDFGNKWWPGRYQKFEQQNVGFLHEYFHKYQTPIFLISNSDAHKEQILTVNPQLKPLNFQKIQDPYTAYQNIFQFVAGTLNRAENKMVKISDADKIAKHGFDKWSFRQKGPKK